MSFVMFIVTEILGALFLFFAYRGIFDLITAFLVVVLMLGLSFHVMVRKPDNTSIRMACFTTALWMASVVAGRLFFEFRGWAITLAALIVFILAFAAAALSTYALIQRPTELDLKD